MSMIQQLVIQTMESLQAHHLKIFQMIGLAQSAVSPRICSRKKRKEKERNHEIPPFFLEHFHHSDGDYWNNRVIVLVVIDSSIQVYFETFYILPEAKSEITPYAPDSFNIPL